MKNKGRSMLKRRPSLSRGDGEALYQRITESIHQRLATGEFSAGDRMYSVAKVQKIYGVSSTTAVRAIEELKKSGAIRSFVGKGSFFNGVPRTVPRNGAVVPLRQVTVCCCVPDFFKNKFHGQICEGIGEEIAARDLRLRLETLPLEDLPGIQVKAPSLQAGDGLILLGAALNRWMLTISLQQIPRLALVDTLFPKVPCVASDNADGIHQVVNRLWELGHRRFLMAAGHPYSPNHANENERIAAFEFLMKIHGASGRIFPADNCKGIIARIRAKDGPTAVLFTQDDPALAFVQAARQAGLRIPEEVSVSGFDGYARRHSGIEELTTLEMDRREMGRTAVRVLAGEIRPLPAVVPWIRIQGVLRESSSTGPAAACKS